MTQAATTTEQPTTFYEALEVIAGYQAELRRMKKDLARAIAEREEIKRALATTDGPADFFRREYKKTSQQLAFALSRIDGVRKRELQERERVVALSGQLDAQRQEREALKKRLWDFWAGLDEGSHKRQLWEIWAAI